MGKLTSLVSGAAGGYLAAQRYADSKDRQKTQDAILNKYLNGGSSNEDSDPMSAFKGVTPVASAPGNPLSDDDRKKLNESAMANGGMVGGIHACADMPQHYDKMGWQRQSFKK